ASETPARVPDGSVTESDTGAGSDSGDDRGADEPGLVAAVQGGDTRAFSTLVARYMDPAYAVALSILRHEQDAEDAVQAAFIRALDRIEQLRPGSRFGPWFYRVLRSTCLNLRRRELLRSHSEVPDTAQSKHNVHREFEQRAARKRVLDALEQLPERQRTAVMMYDLEGYDHADIAEILEIAVGTSRANLHHGRQALRRILTEDGEEE
ncbi:MAG: sigma-70 family RNA polymerase sigma factor, partial [Gemmatimonadota bacterium]|nr:sigma-70 family RNA polymerase sigma factor [Gemmatimonadota bacterium]